MLSSETGLLGETVGSYVDVYVYVYIVNECLELILCTVRKATCSYVLDSKNEGFHSGFQEVRIDRASAIWLAVSDCTTNSPTTE